VLQWTPENAHRAAFEALVRECPRASWQQHHIVIADVIIPLVQPPVALVKGSPEEIAATYAAQRGDLSYDGSNDNGAIDTRLGMLALLETLLRTGSSDWECGKYISACCDLLVEKAIIPNLVWRAGRVESVARKVTLTTCYGLLKAGAISPEALYRHAPHLVPLLASEIEDNDSSSRHLGCLCLNIIFERLKGGFGEQAVHDLYPRLLKRLDDSDDVIRMAICTTFKSFMTCAPKDAYRGTMIGYTLDQLFIHLDDSDPKIQKCVFDVITHIAEHVDPTLVLKKAHDNIQSHRTPVMCETIIRVVKQLAK
jgi:dynein assembly factor 5